MSLPWTHVVVIALSAILMAGFGVWGVDAFGHRRAFGDLLLGCAALAASATLAVYAWRFARRIRREHL